MIYSTVLNPGNFDISPDAPKPDPTPPILTAKEIFMADYSKLNQVRALIDHGILTGNEQEVIDLKNRIQSGFKFEYFNL